MITFSEFLNDGNSPNLSAIKKFFHREGDKLKITKIDAGSKIEVIDSKGVPNSSDYMILNSDGKVDVIDYKTENPPNKIKPSKVFIDKMTGGV